MAEIRNYTLNFGPQHPSAHGVLRLEIISDGGMRLLDDILATAHQASVGELMQPLNQKITFASLANDSDFPAPE